MQVEARVGEQVFRDRVEWDVAEPQNTAEQYAAAVCRDLGLGWSWFHAIGAAVREQLARHLQVSASSCELGHVLHK